MDELICPITLEPFRDPVIISDGFTYERSAIVEYIANCQVPRSPNTRESISTKLVLRNRALTLGRSVVCSLTLEPVKVPAVGSDGRTYEYDALCAFIQGRIKDADCQYYKVPYLFRSDEVVIPNKSLAQYLKLPMPAFATQYFDIPTCKQPSTPPIRDDRIRSLFAEFQGPISSVRLKSEFERLGIPVTADGMYDSSMLVIMNLDLSGMVLKFSSKGRIFYNCNFRSCQFRMCNLDRSQFNYCDLSDSILIDPSFRGEEVSFYHTDMHRVLVSGRRILEKGRTWNVCKTLDEFKRELTERGALGADTISELDA